MRCGQDGTLENEGVYFLATTDSTYSTCNGKNKATLQMQYKLSSQGAYTSAVKELSIGEATTVCGGDLNTEFSYDVRYVLKDTFNTVTVIDFVSTAVYAMHFCMVDAVWLLDRRQPWKTQWILRLMRYSGMG